jgi:hypothetical protein
MRETAGHSLPLSERLRSLGRRERGILAAAIVASLTLHLAGWFLIDASFRAPAPSIEHLFPVHTLSIPEEMPPVLMSLPDIENIALAEVPAALQSAPVEIRPVVPNAEPMAQPSVTPGIQQGTAGATGTAGAPDGETGDPTKNARLEYRLGSQADVWRPAERVPVAQPTDEEIMRARVAGRIGAFNDSIAAEEARRNREADWTKRDGNGGRWGVSNDGIHLGKITLPKELFAFAPPPGRREEFAGRVRTWGEIQSQSARVEGDRVMQDRIKAIRERIEKERAKATGGGGG